MRSTRLITTAAFLCCLTLSACKKQNLSSSPLISPSELKLEFHPSSPIEGQQLILDFVEVCNSPQQKANGKVMLDQAVWEMEASANYIHRATEDMGVKIIDQQETEFELPVEVNGAGKVKVGRGTMREKFNLIRAFLHDCLLSQNTGYPEEQHKCIDYVDLEVKESTFGGHVRVVARAYIAARVTSLSWIIRNGYAYPGAKWVLAPMNPNAPNLRACVIPTGPDAGSNSNYNLATEITKNFVKIRKMGEYDVTINSFIQQPNKPFGGYIQTTPCVSENGMLYNEHSLNRLFDLSETSDHAPQYANYYVKNLSRLLELYDDLYGVSVIGISIQSRSGQCGNNCCLKKFHHRGLITIGNVYQSRRTL